MFFEELTVCVPMEIGQDRYRFPLYVLSLPVDSCRPRSFSLKRYHGRQQDDSGGLIEAWSGLLSYLRGG